MMDYILFFSTIFLGIAFYFSYKKIKKKWFQYKISKIKSNEFPKDYLEILKTSFYPYEFLNQDEQEKLLIKILYFLKYKRFSALQDFSITDEMKVMIAAQACLMILNIDDDIYPSLVNIFISQSPFIEKDQTVNIHGAHLFKSARLGESWKDGPIVLAWSSVKQGMENWHDGSNVVFHEFAHQLDALDGGMDGTPPLKVSKTLNKWAHFMSKDFLDLRDKVTHHHKSDIDPYGATNAAEFFAVTVEQFFEQPTKLKVHHHEMFELYLGYFKIDPSRWAN